jgi:hypothetical protein
MEKARLRQSGGYGGFDDFACEGDALAAARAAAELGVSAARAGRTVANGIPDF